MRKTLNEGDKAPAFSAFTNDNGSIKLSDFKGKKVVLYFYPKDDTPGCTKESCGFAEHSKAFEKNGAVIVGVSRDSVKSHDRFKAKFDLPFALISDEDGKVCEAYGTWAEKKNYGKTYMGIVRSTFLIDEKGIVINIWSNVRVKDHVEKVLEAVVAN